jgi:VWFA-related protein
MIKTSAYFIFTISFLLCFSLSAIGQEKITSSNEKNLSSQFSESVVERVILINKTKKKSKKNKTETDAKINYQTEQIILPVISSASDGEMTKGLKQTDFTVFENNIEQEIIYFKPPDEAITVVLMIDVSNSASVKFDTVKNSFTDFIDKIRPKDRIMVISFDEKTKLIADVNTEREEIKRRINKIEVGGGTSLYDSIDISLFKFLKDYKEPKVFILLTDGVDTTSQKTSFNEVLKTVNGANAVFSVIYHNTFNDFANKKPITVNNSNLEAILNEILRSQVVVGNRRGKVGSGISKEEYEIGINFLNNLVLLSGGNAVKTNSTFAEFQKAFEQIYHQSINQYFVGYNSKNNLPAEQPREIKVRINRPGLYVRTRGSLTIKSNQ